MKNILILALMCSLVFVVPAFAETMCDMGGMTVDQYGYYIGLLGIVCGLVFVMGIKQ